MKIVLIIGFVIAVTAFVVYALGSSLAPGEYDDFDAGVSGPLERGAISVSQESVKVWTRARTPAIRKEREEMFVGMLNPGDQFAILNHFRSGADLWVQIVKSDDPSFKGWVQSKPAEPFKAGKVN